MGGGIYIERKWPGKKYAPCVFPLFLPFAGCQGRCLFCSQEDQTGESLANDEGEISKRLALCAKSLQARLERAVPPPQLAFYGGTFTALPENLWSLCLDFVKTAIDSGLASGFRCSTRPDKLSAQRLTQLVEAGCQLIELGVQSFADKALLATRRGYAGDICRQSCKMAVEAGIEVCAHIMPGLPGGDEGSFLRDVEIALSCGVKFLRLSPCLVLEGTLLARQWRSGQYQPWDMETALRALARAWILSAEGGATVARIGLAPEDSLDKAVLAGPRHPSLGSRVKGLALYMATREMCLKLSEMHGDEPAKDHYKLIVPQFCRGDIWGWRGELLEKWHTLGLEKGNVGFHDQDCVILALEPCAG